ncbi:MAG: hypothetical protein HYT70_03155 [Candidatus Aenigmarchaeota archaeon]|nr:hypothetical protein [Candidatus Aenigmarchaeota archaeon]
MPLRGITTMLHEVRHVPNAAPPPLLAGLLEAGNSVYKLVQGDPRVTDTDLIVPVARDSGNDFDYPWAWQRRRGIYLPESHRTPVPVRIEKRKAPGYLQPVSRLAAASLIGTLFTLNSGGISSASAVHQDNAVASENLQAGKPVLKGPLNNTRLPGLGTELSFTLPSGSVWYHAQVMPYNNDGPGINLIIGDEKLVGAGSYTVQQPVLGEGNYVMLPGMNYRWRIRASSKAAFPAEDDPSWGQWSDEWSFGTANATSATIKPLFPKPVATDAVLDLPEPTVYWFDENPNIFYYEVQVSTDPDFGERGAIAPVWHNLIHGGVTEALNSYRLPKNLLRTGEQYHWRVRPRIQGDGIPVAWSPAWSFRYSPPSGASVTIYNMAKDALEPGIAEAFRNVQNNVNAQSAVEILINMSKTSRMVYDKRTDLLLVHTNDGLISNEEISKLLDVDGDGIPNRIERLQGTSSWDPLDYDPRNISKKYIWIVNGSRLSSNPRSQEALIESDPLEFYHTLKELGYTEDQIYLFSQHSFPGIVAKYVCVFERQLCNERDVTRGNEAKFRSLLDVAGLVDDKVGSDVWLNWWRNGEVGLSDNLLTAYGTVQLDYENNAVTWENLSRSLMSTQTKPNDEIYIVLVDHGGFDEFGRGYFALNPNEALRHYQLNQILRNKQFGRAVIIQDSSYAASLLQDLDKDQNLQLAPLQNVITIGSTWQDNKTGAAYPTKWSSYLLEKNPYLSVGQSLQLLQEFPSDGSRGPHPVYIQPFGMNIETARNGFFFNPSFR